MKKPIRYLSLCGLLGYGYAPESLKNALDTELDFVGVDGGSTDPGPYYLGSGKGFVKRLQVKRDLALVLAEIKNAIYRLSSAAPVVPEQKRMLTAFWKLFPKLPKSNLWNLKPQ